MELYIKDLTFVGYDTEQINQIILAADAGVDLTTIFTPETDVEEMRAFRKKYKSCSPEKIKLISYAKENDLKINVIDLLDKYNYPTIKLLIELEKEGINNDFVKSNYNKKQVHKILNLVKSKFAYNCSYKMFSPNRRIKDYELYKDYKKRGIPVDKFLEEGYNFEQLETIEKYMSKWIDLTSICKPEHPVAFYEFLGETIQDIRSGDTALECTEKQLIEIVQMGFNYKQTQELFYAIEANLDYGKMMNKNFNHHQMSVIGLGLYHDIDVDLYAHPNYTADQMDAIRIVAERIADKSIINNPYSYFDYTMICNSKEYTGREMKEIIHLFDTISKKIEDKSELIKIFHSNSIEQLREIADGYKKKDEYITIGDFGFIL